MDTFLQHLLVTAHRGPFYCGCDVGSKCTRIDECPSFRAWCASLTDGPLLATTGFQCYAYERRWWDRQNYNYDSQLNVKRQQILGYRRLSSSH